MRSHNSSYLRLSNGAGKEDDHLSLAERARKLKVKEVLQIPEQVKVPEDDLMILPSKPAEVGKGMGKGHSLS
jgi:hypothetical protein